MFSKSSQPVQTASQPSGDTAAALFKRYAQYYLPHWHIAAMGALFLLAAALTEPLIPAMMKRLLDYAGQHSVPAISAATDVKQWPWWLPPVVVVALFGLRALFVLLANLGLGTATNKALVGLQTDLFEHVQHADLSLYQHESSSSLNNTFRLESANAAAAFAAVVQDGVRNALTACALLAWLFWMNWQLTLLALVLLPLVAVLVRLIGRRLRRVMEGVALATDGLSYAVEEHTNAHRAIRVYGAQAQQRAHFGAALQRLHGQQMRTLLAASLMTPVTQIAAALALATILALALQHNQQGALSVGSLAAYVTAMLMLIAPLKALGDVYPALQRGRVALGRIFDLMDYPAEHLGGTYAPAQPAQGDMVFEAVGKTYAGAAQAALKQIHLRIAPKTMVALVGASGSGKTTLANLLPRFVRADAGRILLDGVDLNDWSLPALRQQLALVSQDTILLNDTVLANVAFGVADASRIDPTRVEQALKDAYLWEHIQSLPQGVHTHIGHNGQLFSGGQRQRLAIARALYKAAPILILDEATSALDTESERAVQEAIGRLTHGCTTLVIAHRLSTVRHADLIVVMHAGEVVETGRYDELLERQGVFAQLVQQQLL